MQKLLLPLLVLGTAAPVALAAPVDTGSLLQQIQQDQQQHQLLPEQPPEIKPLDAPQDEVGETDALRFTVKSIDITNVTRFPVEALRPLLKDVIDHEVSLGELKERVKRITDFYHQKGYPAAYAYLPPQEIGEDGNVEVRVLEGYLGKIRLHNNARLYGEVAQLRLPQMAEGDVIEVAPLEESILYLSDIPGIEPNLEFSPGSDTGFSDIDITLADKQPTLGVQASIDNQGSRYTGGGWRGNLRTELRNPSGYGDQLSVNGMDGGLGLSFIQAQYQLPVALTDKAKVGIEYSEIAYKLGGQFANAGVQGLTRTSGFYSIFPVSKSTSFNLNLEARYQQKLLRDEIQAVFDNKERRIYNKQLALTGDARNSGITTWNLALNWGSVDYTGWFHWFLDAISAQTQGPYRKVNLSVMHLQPVTLFEHTNLSVMLSGQRASKNLDSAEKFALGGAHGVRAYPASEGMGDDGAMLNLDLKRDVPELMQGLQFSLFADVGRIKGNHTPWPAVVNGNYRTLSGGGLGIRYEYGKSWNASLQSAWRFTNALPTSGSDRPRGRLWFELSMNLI